MPFKGSGEVVCLSGEKGSHRAKKIIFAMLFCHLTSSTIKDATSK